MPVPGLGVEEGGGFPQAKRGDPPRPSAPPPGGAGGSRRAPTGLLTRGGPAGGRRAVRGAGRPQAGRRQAAAGGRVAAVGAAHGAQSGTQPSSQSPDRQGNTAQRVTFFRALRAHDSVWRWSSGARGVGPQGSAPRRPSPAGCPVGPAALRAQRGDSGSAAVAQQGGPSVAAAAPRPCDAGAPAAAAAAGPRRPRSHGSVPRVNGYANGGGARGGSEAGGVEPPCPSGPQWGGPRCRSARQLATPSGPVRHPPGRSQRGTSARSADGRRGSPAPPWLLERSGAAAGTQRAIDPSSALGGAPVLGRWRTHPGGDPGSSGRGSQGRPAR